MQTSSSFLRPLPILHRMNPYGCLSTGAQVGMIEVVLSASTIAKIQKKKGTDNLISLFKGMCLQCQLLVKWLWSSLRVSLNTGLDYWADNNYKYNFSGRSPDELLPPFLSAVLLPSSLHLCECCSSSINSSTAQDLYHTLSRGDPAAGMGLVIQHKMWWLNFTACVTCVSETT